MSSTLLVVQNLSLLRGIEKVFKFLLTILLFKNIQIVSVRVDSVSYLCRDEC